MLAPDFWRGTGRLSGLLLPAACAYAAVAALRAALARPVRAEVPVICVGNIVAGGAGKTPVALALAEILKARKLAPHFLSRGYGGTVVGPERVNPLSHTAAEVGDEALLLAAAAPTWVSRRRVAGARAAVAGGAGIVVMDDGHQNPSLAKDLSLIVVDGGFGFGNGRVMPAGPLRESISAGLKRAHAMVIIGRDRLGVAAMARGLPILRARLVPGPEASALKGRRALAFAGIGRPSKFFETLTEIGADVRRSIAFPDHHPYRPEEIEAILAEAESTDAVVVTTAKDAVRLPPELRERVAVLSVRLTWDDEAALNRLLDRALARA